MLKTKKTPSNMISTNEIANSKLCKLSRITSNLSALFKNSIVSKISDPFGNKLSPANSNTSATSYDSTSDNFPSEFESKLSVRGEPGSLRGLTLSALLRICHSLDSSPVWFKAGLMFWLKLNSSLPRVRVDIENDELNSPLN